jgi:hypothetical protein
VALAGRYIGQGNVAGMAGPDAISARDGDGDGSCGDLAIGVGTVFFEEVVRATRV